MAAFCGLIQNFVACSDNGLAQQRAFFSVSFRDINYISALSSRLRHGAHFTLLKRNCPLVK